MSPMRLLFGVLSGLFGLLAAIALAGASAFRQGFGGDPIPLVWFAVPVSIALGGPAFFWIVLPYRDRLRQRLRR
jgi:hypothetical protein